MIRFSRRYFLLTLLLFITEVLIALYVHDAFVRPYAGDYLVVFLIYFAVCTFIEATRWKIALGVLVFSYAVETMQYFHVVDQLGLSGNVLARTVIGTGFEWRDILAYTLGGATLLLLDKRRN